MNFFFFLSEILVNKYTVQKKIGSNDQNNESEAANSSIYPFYHAYDHQCILDHMKRVCYSQEQTITETLKLVLNRDPIRQIIPFVPFHEIQSISINQFRRIRSLGLGIRQFILLLI